ncbi:hypothetical protein GQ44DRAFT_706153 [Phaeosphaeriaceae sp. PMI808]|nr:hypothetical protein GQ44DRAFT_706153 [Phaeosphaeriaceae sp. PMI808]
MILEAPAPSRHISSTPISRDDASRMLETYITNSESHPHLHPDALITPTGVTFSSKGGPMGSVVMHNLRRVAAGLRGEYLEPEKTPEPEDNDENTEGANKKINKKLAKKRKEVPAVVVDDWQDKAEWEQEEGMVEVEEIGPRTTVVRDGGEEPGVQVTGSAQENATKKQKKSDEANHGHGKMDKDARRQAKRERNGQRKRDAEKQRALKA